MGATLCKPVILLAEEYNNVARVISIFLRRVGYDVLIVSNGTDALRLFHTRHEELSLIILDANMPDISGRQVLAEIRKVEPNLPVLLSSGYPSEYYTHLLDADGCTGFLPKPTTLLTVRHYVESAITGQSLAI